MALESSSDKQNVDFLIIVFANEPVPIGGLTDESLMNDMYALPAQTPRGCRINYISPC